MVLSTSRREVSSSLLPFSVHGKARIFGTGAAGTKRTPYPYADINLYPESELGIRSAHCMWFFYTVDLRTTAQLCLAKVIELTEKNRSQ